MRAYRPEVSLGEFPAQSHARSPSRRHMRLCSPDNTRSVGQIYKQAINTGLSSSLRWWLTNWAASATVRYSLSTILGHVEHLVETLEPIMHLAVLFDDRAVQRYLCDRIRRRASIVIARSP
jgi:hypothetical protein